MEADPVDGLPGYSHPVWWETVMKYRDRKAKVEEETDTIIEIQPLWKFVTGIIPF